MGTDESTPFQQISLFFCLKICLTFTNSEEPNEMQHNYAEFHLGLHCLQKKTRLGVSRIEYKGLTAYSDDQLLCAVFQAAA